MEFLRIIHVLTIPFLGWAFWLAFKQTVNDTDDPMPPEDLPKAVAITLALFAFFLFWQFSFDPVGAILLNLAAVPLFKLTTKMYTAWNSLDAVRRYRESMKPPSPPSVVEPLAASISAPDVLERIVRQQLNQGRVIPDQLKTTIQRAIDGITSADTQVRILNPPTEQPSPEQLREHYEAAYLTLFDAYFQHFPKASDPTFFEAPLTSVLPVGQVISNVLKATVWGDRPFGCFKGIYKTVNDHAWGVTRQFLSEKEIASGKKIWPSTYPGEPADIPNAYLRETPLLQLFQHQTLAVAIPARLRLEHMFVLAPSGSGKTQLMQSMIARDLEQVAAGEASIVVIDSQGVNRRRTNAPTLVENLIHLQLFAEEMKGKLTYIKPSANLSFNLLDMGQNDPDLSDEQRQVRKTAAREGVLTALGGGSDLQYQMLAWCLRLAMSSDTVPTIRTLRRILAVDDAKKFQEEFKGLLKDERVDNLTREYFQHLHQGARNTTREALISRIDGLFTEDTFREMLQKPSNDFRMIDEIEAGKVIVVDADKSLLGERGAEAFGRFFLAQLLYASRQRQSTKPVYVYIDECQDFISDDENISKLLVQARKNDIGLILATQNLTNIHSPVVRENMQGVAITVTHNEERRGVMNLKLRGRPQPIEVQLDYGVMETMPRMTDEQFAELHRRKVPPPPQLIPPPLKPATNDDDVIH